MKRGHERNPEVFLRDAARGSLTKQPVWLPPWVPSVSCGDAAQPTRCAGQPGSFPENLESGPDAKVQNKQHALLEDVGYSQKCMCLRCVDRSPTLIFYVTFYFPFSSCELGELKASPAHPRGTFSFSGAEDGES